CTLAVMRDVHGVASRNKIAPNFLKKVIQVWQAYGDLGAMPDRDPESTEVVFGGKAVSLEDFAPHRAVVGTPDDCIRELESIRDLTDPEYLFITPTGVPDPDQQIEE